ncbi:MAG: hypothetical protein MJ062_01335, partial [Oscillospiraceae bacterium]|nr:hypothetical protein [Oscillospiraceae bacterium]
MKGKLSKRLTALLSTAAMLLTCADLSAMDLSVHAEGTPEYVAFDVNGDGETAEGELAYKLVSAEDLYWFANKVNSGDEFLAAFLANDITVNSAVLDENGKLNEGDSFKNWTPAGNDSNIYSGKFNGAGHTISGLYFNDSGTDYVGLFGYVSSGGEIRNVTVADSYFCGRYYVGGACGQNYGLFENCCNAGAVIGNTIVGGVCGDNCGTIKKCYNTGDVEGNRIGGICGMNTNTLENCYNKGAVKGNNSGGICGTNKSTISNCYYLADSDDGNGGKTENQFRSGEVCWLLNGEKAEAPVFFQTLGTDESPVLDSTHNTVYKNKACDGVSDYYNSENKDQEHAYENGICTICDGYEPATDSDSDGVYEISNAGQLYWFTNEVNIDNDGDANAVLTKDITVNSGVLDENGELNSDTSNFRAWINYGSQYYQGTFDGAGYTISGLYFNDSDTTYVGLFGLNSGTIKNVSVTDSYFCGNGYVGGVCGYNKGIIENCSNTGTAESNCYAGGICGYNGCTIKNCSNTGAVEGSESAGGICGDNAKDGTIEYCYNIGDATAIGENAYAGGVCGYNYGTIENCYYLDTVAEDSYATAMSETAFASGEVCWLLNGEKGESPAFFQNLGTDNFPVLDNTHNTVYKNKACDGVSDHYNHENKNQEHAYENGICTICDGCVPAKAVADVNDIDGDGETSDDVYEISNAGQLYWFAGLVNGTLEGVGQKRYANAVLTKDITVNSGVLDEDGELNEGDFRAWTPIGYYDSLNKSLCKYSGTFDGAGYTISGLYFNDSGADYVGLFGANGSTIKNVIVADSYFCGKEKVGGICGSNSNKKGKIENCYNTAKVSGSIYVGGVCGYNYQATISNCFNTGNISAEEYVGGVCGNNKTESTILNCYNTGKVSGSEKVGGISGENSDINLITNCYNTGKVEGSTDVGGICGNNCIYCEVTNCYYLEVDGLNGINGYKNSAEVTAKNETDFASGEVCWLLNGGETQAETPVFFQTLGEDDFPVLDSTHKTVYLTSPCIAYTNTEGETAEHCFKDEICEKCGAFKDGIGARLSGVSLVLD